MGPCVISIATPDDLGCGAGAGNQPIAQLLDSRAAMRNGSLAQALSAGIDQANLMALARPVDAHKPFNLFRHAQTLLSHHTPPGRRNERQSLYWRSRRNLPRDFRRGRPAGVQVRSRCSKTRGFAGDSRQASPVRPVYNADQPITALKGTGIRTLGPPVPGGRLERAQRTEDGR